MANEISQMFNSAIASSAVSSAFELGILEELHQNGKIQIREFCNQRDLHEGAVTGIIWALIYAKICEATNEKFLIKKGELFTELYQNKGCFLWMVNGYGYLLQNLASVAKNENRIGNFMKPNGKYISIATRDYGRNFVDRYFEYLLNEFPFAVAADLGCGSAERLINLANQHPSMLGIGIDINPDALKVAKTAIVDQGLQERITVLQGNMNKLEARTEFAEVDVLFSFFSGHDLWPWDNCLQVMQNLRVVFPNLKRFLLCDTYRSGIVPSSDLPIFTLGFELTHAVMGQYIPSLTEWMTLFTEAGWKCVKRQDLEAPFSTIFDLRPL